MQQLGLKHRFLHTSFALFLFLSSLQAWALPGQHCIGAGAGQVLLLSEYAKNYDNAIGFAAMYEYDASQLFGLSTRLHYSNHKAVGTATTQPNPADQLSVTGLIPNLKVNFAFLDRLTVYGLAGFGIYLIDMMKSPQKANVFTFGFNLGVGFELPLFTNFKFGTSLTFHNVFDKKDPTSQTSTLSALGVGGTYMDLFLNAMFVF